MSPIIPRGDSLLGIGKMFGLGKILILSGPLSHPLQNGDQMSISKAWVDINEIILKVSTTSNPLIEPSLCDRHCPKGFTQIYSFSSHFVSINKVLWLLTLLYR